MAVTINVQDLINFPGNVKTMSVDQVSIVPQGFEGDEQYLLKFSTSAYSDTTERTPIQDYYINNFKSGWVVSSGFTGSAGKFNLSASAYKLMVKLDSTISGTNGNGYYEIELNYEDDDIALSGETIAEDLELKIRALADNLEDCDVGFASAYRNASVEYKSGKFWIVSGSVSEFYNGVNRTYADIISGSTNDALAILGFDLKINSSVLNTLAVREALLSVDYTISGTNMYINQSIGAFDGDCIMITDRTNTDYFQLDSDPVGGTLLHFSSSVVTNNYTAGVAKVQLLREQDPNASPTCWFTTVDKVTRHGIKSIINLIDFSE